MIYLLHIFCLNKFNHNILSEFDVFQIQSQKREYDRKKLIKKGFEKIIGEKNYYKYVRFFCFSNIFNILKNAGNPKYLHYRKQQGTGQGIGENPSSKSS